MPSLQIRELPVDVYEALSFRAERAGRSLAQQAIVELRRAAGEQRDDRRAVLDDVRARIRTAGTTTFDRTPEQILREDRTR